MKFFRKRWWGFYALTPFVMLAIPVTAVMSVVNFSQSNYLGIFVGIPVTVICILGLLYLYAPYTFHFVGRFIGLLAFVGYCWYLIDCIKNGHWFSNGRSNEYAFNAALGLIAFGIPGLLVFLFNKKPIKNPYRHDGILRKPLLREIREFEQLSNDDEK